MFQAPKRPPPPNRASQSSKHSQNQTTLSHSTNQPKPVAAARTNIQVNNEQTSVEHSSHSTRNSVTNGTNGSDAKPLGLPRSTEIQRAHERMFQSRQHENQNDKVNSSHNGHKGPLSSHNVSGFRPNTQSQEAKPFSQNVSNNTQFISSKTTQSASNHGTTSDRARTPHTLSNQKTVSQISKPALPAKPKPTPPPKLIQQNIGSSKHEGDRGKSNDSESRVNKVIQMFER